MKKIPTLFLRDPENLKLVLTEPNPACAWVFAGEGTATRKYDGTCVRYDEDGAWWSRREVKPGKTPPAGWIEADHDPVTGKSVGWEPIAQSAFYKYFQQAIADEYGICDDWSAVAGQKRTAERGKPVPGGTYELCGPKINGNPEGILGDHLLVRHGYRSAAEYHELMTIPRDYDGLRAWLAARPGWEGVVFHHEDGRRAKIKTRDFPSPIGYALNSASPGESVRVVLAEVGNGNG